MNHERNEAFQPPIGQDRLLDEEPIYYLRLYIAGKTPNSVRALRNIHKICEEHLKDRYQLEVIDVHESPHLVLSENIVAIPTLIKKLPLPLQRIIGDMSNTERVLLGLDLLKHG
ncbi:MAG: circadian clock KaiB family protein [Leptolyngbyaceae cyanobacterium bins.59]|nr:circadian clock KaiB family protein [Leptolyngbyaceae cyanobacterium bins.59]